MPYLEVFGIKFEKVISYFKSPPWNLSNHKITKKKKTKQKCLNFGPKTPYLGILAQEFLKAVMIFEMLRFGTKNTFLDIAGLELQKTIVIFEISTLKLVKLENLQKSKIA